MTGGKPPKDMAKFADRNNLEAPLSPEEEAAKKAEDEANAGKKGKKDKKKEKKKKSKKSDKEDKAEVAKIGPSECIQKFDEFYASYNTQWADRDETDNNEQSFDREMARVEVLPMVEKEKEKMVEQMIA